VGLLPCAGRGLRSGLPFPKELFPVDSVPVIRYSFNAMKDAKASRFFVILGKDKELIMRYMGNGESDGVKIAYLFQKEPNGLAKSILEAEPFIEKNDRLLMGMPDTVIRGQFSFGSLLDQLQKNEASVSLALFKVGDPQNYGVVEVDARNEDIISIEDKPEEPKSSWIWGAVAFTADFFDEARRVGLRRGEYQLTDAFSVAREAGLKVMAVRFSKATYMDVGTKRLIV
jgi:dTDP-glucose pyrophosphorylase